MIMNKRKFQGDSLTVKSPFFYIIQHKESKKYYAGYSSSKRKCDSSLFMCESGYQTSSKDIRSLIAEKFTFGLEIFDIIRIRHFHSQTEAIQYETKFLTKVNAKRNDRFYNMSNGHKDFFLSPEANERRRLKSLGRKHSHETILKMKSRVRSKNECEKISHALKGKPKSEEHKAKLRGREFSKDTREKMSLAWKERKFTASELANRAAARVGCKWWNDGNENKFCKKCPGSVWMPGMAFRKRK